MDGNVNNKDVSCIANQIGDTKNNGKGKKEPVTTTAVAASLSDGLGIVVGQILFAYDEVGHLIGEYDELGNRVREYVWLGDQPLATIQDDGVYYIHSDHLNTPKVVTDENQSIVWRADYQPFGETEETVSTVDMLLRFAGQYQDDESGLHYNYFRSYDPQTGRYSQNDPIGLQGGLNLFLYANANPLRFTDPDGLDPNQPDYSACSYYDGVAKKHGCKYHKAAADICRGNNRLVNAITALCRVTTAQLNCIRKCLVNSDKSARKNPDCQIGECGEGGCTRKEPVNQIV